jgi:hypothetical protein
MRDDNKHNPSWFPSINGRAEKMEVVHIPQLPPFWGLLLLLNELDGIDTRSQSKILPVDNWELCLQLLRIYYTV